MLTGNLGGVLSCSDRIVASNPVLPASVPFAVANLVWNAASSLLARSSSPAKMIARIRRALICELSNFEPGYVRSAPPSGKSRRQTSSADRTPHVRKEDLRAATILLRLAATQNIDREAAIKGRDRESAWLHPEAFGRELQSVLVVFEGFGWKLCKNLMCDPLCGSILLSIQGDQIGWCFIQNALQVVPWRRRLSPAISFCSASVRRLRVWAESPRDVGRVRLLLPRRER